VLKEVNNKQLFINLPIGTKTPITTKKVRNQITIIYLLNTESVRADISNYKGWRLETDKDHFSSSLTVFGTLSKLIGALGQTPYQHNIFVLHRRTKWKITTY